MARNSAISMARESPARRFLLMRSNKAPPSRTPVRKDSRTSCG
jgi:hypothetical protein